MKSASCTVGFFGRMLRRERGAPGQARRGTRSHPTADRAAWAARRTGTTAPAGTFARVHHDQLPEQLRQWHAPRINRWERLWVSGGSLVIEYLRAIGTTSVELGMQESRWFAPGTRWRVVHMARDTSFELGVHADVKGQAEAPQSLRADLLEELTVMCFGRSRRTAARMEALGSPGSTSPFTILYSL